MSYVIMRMKKLKTRASVASSGRHNFRERETPNADASLTLTNSHEKAQSTNDLMRRLTMNIPTPKIGEKCRSCDRIHGYSIARMVAVRHSNSED